MYIIKLDNAENDGEFGSKASGLCRLRKDKLPVPDGFVINTRALELFMSSNQIRSRLPKLDEIADRSPSGLREIEENVRDIFVNSVLPADLRNEIMSAYGNLSVSEDVKMAGEAFSLIKAGRDHELVAIRGSVGRGASDSFAGLIDSFMNVSGKDELFRCIKLCWASLFYPHALIYGEKKGIENTNLSILVQKMAESEKSGIVLTNFGGNKTLVEGSWGIGNAVSSGIVTPDEYLLDANGALMEKNISKKLWMYSRNEMTGLTERDHVPGSKMDVQVLSETDLKKISEISERISAAGNGQQIIDWCIGRNKISVLDVKPGNYEISQADEMSTTGEVVVTGRFVSKGNVTGTVKIIGSSSSQFGIEDVALSASSDCRDLIMASGAGGFLTDEGGRLCNFGILARELQVPVMSGTQNATSVLGEGEKVVMSAQHGKVISVQERPHGSESLPQAENAYNGGTPQLQPAEHEMPFPLHPKEDQLSQQPLPDENTGGMQHDNSATRIFAKVGPDMIGRVEGAEGYVVYQIQSDPSMLDGPQSKPGIVWGAYTGEQDFQQTLEMLNRISVGGEVETILMVPAVRGPEDIENAMRRAPFGSRLGVNIKTPAMALSFESLLRDDLSAVCLDIASLSQLTMGLKEPGSNVHPSVLKLIADVGEKCRERGIPVSASVSPEYATEENINIFVSNGFDVICVEPESVEMVRNAVRQSENSADMPPEQPETQTTENTVENEQNEPFQPFDFSPSSFS